MRVVIPSLGYGDLLAHTLLPWVKLLGQENIRVVSHADDDETARAASLYDVKVIETDAWSKDGAKLNKAAALDVGFGFQLDGSRPHIGEMCLALDADVLPRGMMPSGILAGVLYGCKRFGQNGRFQQVANIAYIKSHGRGDSPEACGGYFQLFLYREGMSFGSFPTAAAYDYVFAFSFARGQTLSCIEVVHLSERHKHWAGRVKE